MPFELGRRLAGGLPDATLLAVPGGDHNGLWDRPGVLEAVLHFTAGAQRAP